jgi:tellurite resistance protein TehA-like permease
MYPAVVKAEYLHPVRFNFLVGPCIAICMLAIAMPPDVEDPKDVLQVIWVIALFYQFSAALVVYHRWLFASDASEMAAAPYLLSIVSWFLLCLLGRTSGMDKSLELPVSAMCYGVGCFFSVFVYPFILTGIHSGRTERGSPALFLMLAPLSVAGLGLAALSGGQLTAGAEAIFGIVVCLFFLLARQGPKLLERPIVIGVYWAYVFPLAAMATFAINIARTYQSALAETVAAILSVMAILGFFAVISRMSFHMFQVARGNAAWIDPLVKKMEAAKAAAENTTVSDTRSDAALGATPSALLLETKKTC